MVVGGDVWKVFTTPTPTLRGGGVWNIVGGEGKASNALYEGSQAQ
jgi:hypothetical protein